MGESTSAALNTSIFFQIITLIIAVTGVVAVVVRTRSAQTDASTERDKLVTKMAGQLLDSLGRLTTLVADKAESDERERGYQKQVDDCIKQNDEIKAQLKKAYGVVELQNGQMTKLLDKLIEADTPGAAEIVKEVQAAINVPPPPVVTQETVAQVAAAPTPEIIVPPVEPEKKETKDAKT